MMKQKFKVKVNYTFNGYFTLRTASGKEAARLILEQCGTVLNDIQTTLGNESEIDWQFGLHPDRSIRDVRALPETIAGERLPGVRIFHPGQRVFWRDPEGKTSGYYTVHTGNDEKEEPSTDDIIGIASRNSEAETYPQELKPVRLLRQESRTLSISQTLNNPNDENL